VAEERLDRVKNSSAPDPVGRWFASVPTRSVEYCLKARDIHYHDLDVVVFCSSAVGAGDRICNLTVADCIPQLPWSPYSRMFTINHHFAHAYGAFASAGLDEAAVLVVDEGSVTNRFRRSDGSWAPRRERASIYRGGKELELILKVEDRPGELP